MENIQQRAKIAVDLDEVLNEFFSEFLKWYNQKNNTHWAYEDAVYYDWSKLVNISYDSAQRFVYDFFETVECQELSVVDGAKEAMRKLAGKYDLYLITARQKVFEDITISWVNKNFPGLFKQIILVNHYSLDNSPKREKHEVCKELNCKAIIDDNPYQVQSFLDYGIKVILLNKPWNKNQNFPESVIRADNIKEVPGIVKELVL